MSDSGKHIKDKFSGFEPDVDDTTIDKNWEKIRYFLPQEKKRRGGFFFRTGGQRKLFTVLSVLCLGLGIVASLIWLSDPKKENTTIQKIAEPELNNSRPAPDKNVNAKPAARETLHGEHGATAKIAASAARPGTGHNVSGSATTSKKNTDAKRHAAVISQGIVGAANASLPAIADNTHEAGSIVRLQEATTGPAVSTANRDSLPYVLLPSILFHIKDADLALMDVRSAAISTLQPASKWSLELLAGGCHASTSLQEAGSALVINDKPIQFSTGLGLAYQFHKKWHVNGQLRISGNRLEYMHETEEKNRILDKQQSTSTGAPQPVPDTIIVYVQAKTIGRIRSQINYQAGLGIGYTVLQKKKWAFEVFAQFALKYTAYTFSSQDQQGTDTLNYFRSGTSDPLANQEQSRAEEYNQRHSTISIGLMPGMAASYRLTNRMSLIVKPAGFIQLSQNKLGVAQKQYSLRQNALFVDIGIRIKL